MAPDFWVSAGVGAMLASLHLWFPWFETRLAPRIPAWLPFTGGAAVGYVALYMLPKLGDKTVEIMAKSEVGATEFWLYRLYLFLLAGIVAEVIADRIERTNEHSWGALGFDIVVHAVYGFFAGLLVVESPRAGALPRLLIATALGLHLMGMVHHLRLQHAALYDGALRWLLFATVLGGVLVGELYTLPGGAIAAMTAFVSGVVLVTVMANELPDPERHRISPFLAGAGLFTLLIMALRSLPPAP